MSGDSSAIHPLVIWAQRSDKIMLTINLEDCQNPTVEFTETSLIFRGKGGPESKEYEAKIDFFKEINPAESKYAVLPRHIPMSIKKKVEGPYWNRLLKDSKKVHWLKTDFEKWRDEDDSDVDEGSDMAFEDMMKQMGNFDTKGGPPAEEEAEEEDSDDEELPDLE